MQQNIPVLHPSNTVQISQASDILWRRRRLHARTISSPATLLCIWSCCYIYIKIFGHYAFEDTPTLTCFNIQDLIPPQFYPLITINISYISSLSIKKEENSPYHLFVGSRCMFLFQNIDKIHGIKERHIWHPYNQMKNQLFYITSQLFPHLFGTQMYAVSKMWNEFIETVSNSPSTPGPPWSE